MMTGLLQLYSPVPPNLATSVANIGGRLASKTTYN